MKRAQGEAVLAGVFHQELAEVGIAAQQQQWRGGSCFQRDGALTCAGIVFAKQKMETIAPAYAVSKAALNALTLQLAVEMSGSGILVNAVCPGWTATYPGAAEHGARPVADGAASVVLGSHASGRRAIRRFLPRRRAAAVVKPSRTHRVSNAAPLKLHPSKP